MQPPKNVGIILWAGYYAFDRDMENVCRYFADMGVKGLRSILWIVTISI